LQGGALSASVTSAVNWTLSPMFMVARLGWMPLITGALAAQVETWTVTVAAAVLVSTLFETVRLTT
jgi:hypothetical protein